MTRVFLARIAVAAAVAGTLAVPAAAQSRAVPRYGNFILERAKDPITDADRSLITALAERPPYMPTTLSWGCDGDRWFAYVRGIPLTMDKAVQVTWRFDQNPPETAAWEMFSPNFISVPDDRLDDFTDAAEKAATLAVRITTASGDTQTSIFHLNGAANAFKQLACMNESGDSAAAH